MQNAKAPRPSAVFLHLAFCILHYADFGFVTCSLINDTMPDAAGVRYRPRAVISPTDTVSDGSVSCAAWNPSPHCRSGRHPDGRIAMPTPAQTWWRMLINRSTMTV